MRCIDCREMLLWPACGLECIRANQSVQHHNHGRLSIDVWKVLRYACLSSSRSRIVLGTGLGSIVASEANPEEGGGRIVCPRLTCAPSKGCGSG
jgi:hypothetical protein